MKFGLVPINIGVQSIEHMLGLASKAEELGFESVWTFEHVIVPVEYRSRYPYNDSGKMGADPETNFVDPLIALTAIAASTTRLRLGTGVNILSQANPLYLAKQAASLDFLSSGRLLLGLGIGWLREEFEAMGVPFERRGARFDDYVAAMRKVWSGEVVDHESEFLSWHGFKSYPLPEHKARLPVIVGGNKGRIWQRIARHGDGWFAPSTSAEEIGKALTELRAACEAEKRDFSELEITSMWTGRGGAEAVGALETAGVSRVVVPLPALGEDPLEGMSRLAAEVIG
jgi:probable F420-dependent oxidoreductase